MYLPTGFDVDTLCLYVFTLEAFAILKKFFQMLLHTVFCHVDQINYQDQLVGPDQLYGLFKYRSMVGSCGCQRNVNEFNLSSTMRGACFHQLVFHPISKAKLFSNSYPNRVSSENERNPRC